MRVLPVPAPPEISTREEIILVQDAIADVVRAPGSAEWRLRKHNRVAEWGIEGAGFLEAPANQLCGTTRLGEGRLLHVSTVLEPAPVAKLDLPALHLEHEHSSLRNRDHEITLGFLPVFREDGERVPAVPTGRELLPHGIVDGDLCLRRGRARPLAWVDAGLRLFLRHRRLDPVASL